MSAVEQPDQPKLVSQCAMLYAKMAGDAKEVEDSPGDLIWSGKLIKTCAELGINVGSYSRVINALRKLGCVEQIEQGYRSKPSIYRIHFPPTPEVWRDNAPDRTEDLTSAPSSDTMAAAVRDLQSQIGGINIVEALRNIEGQIAAVRQEIERLKQEVSTARSQQP